MDRADLWIIIHHKRCACWILKLTQWLCNKLGVRSEVASLTRSNKIGFDEPIIWALNCLVFTISPNNWGRLDRSCLVGACKI
jgi:hypothetical protein